MKKILSIIIILAYGYDSEAQRKTTRTISNGGPNYVLSVPKCSDYSDELYLVWSDDFNGTSLDLTKWKPSLPWGATNDDSGDTWCDSNEISFTGNTVAMGCNYNPNPTHARDYSIGVISTLEEVHYGYYEIRCRIPRICQHWPAFWLIGECNQEIDVFEFTGKEDKLMTGCNPDVNKWFIPRECASANPIMSFHNVPKPSCILHSDSLVVGTTLEYSEWDVKHTPFDPTQGCEYSDVNVDVDFHAEWHKFGLKFSEDAIIWYIDDVPVVAEYRYFTMNGPFYVPITDLKSYCESNNYTPVYEQMNFPKKELGMKVVIGNGHKAYPDYNLYDFVKNWYNWPEGFLEVDNFKYYRFTECHKDLNFCSNADLNKYSNNVRARTIYLNTSCTINTPPDSLIFRALNEIGILSEFSMTNSSEFKAEIKGCTDGVVKRLNKPAPDSSQYIGDNTVSKSSAIKPQTDVYTRFSISPNPSTGSFRIQTFSQSPKQLVVWDNLGNMVYKDTFSTEEHLFHLDAAPGAYTVELRFDQIIDYKKIIIVGN